MSDESSCRHPDLAQCPAYLEGTLEGLEQRIESLESENRRLRKALRDR